jgi:hypothetical protein
MTSLSSMTCRTFASPPAQRKILGVLATYQAEYLPYWYDPSLRACRCRKGSFSGEVWRPVFGAADGDGTPGGRGFVGAMSIAACMNDKCH